MGLETDLHSYFNCADASGAALDNQLVGRTSLNDQNGTVDLVSGGGPDLGACRFFESSGQNYYNDGSAGTPTEYAFEGDFSVAAWVRPVDLAENYYFVARWHNSISARQEWALRYGTGSGKFFFSVRQGPADVVFHTHDASTPASDTWHFIAAGYEEANDIIWIAVDDLGRETIGGPGGMQKDFTNRNFTVGATVGSDVATAMYGYMDKIGIWKRTLEDAEILQLYNGGAGLEYPFAVAGSGSKEEGSLGPGGRSKIYLPPTLILP